MQARADVLKALKHTQYDVLVVGGGAVGLGVALDCALRGLKTALVEAGDYASGASSVSTKLVHGGVRYLRSAFVKWSYDQYELLLEALSERTRILENAPHLAHSCGFVIPAQTRFRQLYYAAGLKLYDLLAFKSKLPKSTNLDFEQTFKAFPWLKVDDFIGSVLYYDGCFNDALMAVALARTADKLGADVLNYASCVGFELSGSGRFGNAIIEDKIGGDIVRVNAGVIINCTGAQADSIRRLIRPDAQTKIRPSKGVHLILKSKIPLPNALLIPETNDDRVLFLIPWLHGTVLAGTTDTLVNDPQTAPTATYEDVEFILNHINQYLSEPLDFRDIKSTFAGYRPLLAQDADSQTFNLPRSHEIEVWKKENIIHVLGGKWTTYRLMAEQAVDMALRLLRKPRTRCTTANYPLIGAKQSKFTPPEPRLHYPEFPNDVHDHLLMYGSEDMVIKRLMKDYGFERLHPEFPYTTAEVQFVVQHTGALTIEDVLARRLRLQHQDIEACYMAAPLVANILANHLGWNERYKQDKLRDYRRQLGAQMAFLQL